LFGKQTSYHFSTDFGTRFGTTSAFLSQYTEGINSLREMVVSLSPERNPLSLCSGKSQNNYSLVEMWRASVS
jgi:hypothetical protein